MKREKCARSVIDHRHILNDLKMAKFFPKRNIAKQQDVQSAIPTTTRMLVKRKALFVEISRSSSMPEPHRAPSTGPLRARVTGRPQPRSTTHPRARSTGRPPARPTRRLAVNSTRRFVGVRLDSMQIEKQNNDHLWWTRLLFRNTTFSKIVVCSDFVDFVVCGITNRWLFGKIFFCLPKLKNDYEILDTPDTSRGKVRTMNSNLDRDGAEFRRKPLMDFPSRLRTSKSEKLCFNFKIFPKKVLRQATLEEKNLEIFLHHILSYKTQLRYIKCSLICDQI